MIMKEVGGLKAIDMKGKAYVMVHTRVSGFHAMYPNGRIETELIGDPSVHVFMRAKVTPNVEHPERYFIGHSQSKWTGMIAGAAALEVAETSAVGRALGFLNIGIEDGLCSADELEKAKSVPTAKADNVFSLERELVKNKPSQTLGDITESFVQVCEDNQLTDADLYKFARGLNSSSCKKLGINFPAVPEKSDKADEPFIGVADTALLTAIVKHSKLVVERIRGESK
jgi:hypothetical protein